MSKLNSFSLFSNFDPTLKERLERSIDWFPVSKGLTIIEQGSPSDFAVFVLEGSFEILRHTNQGEIKYIASGKAGTILGEIGLLTESSRTASCRAEQDAVVGVLSKKDLAEMCETDSKLYIGLIKALGASLANRLVEITVKVDALADTQKIAFQAANMILEGCSGRS